MHLPAVCRYVSISASQRRSLFTWGKQLLGESYRPAGLVAPEKGTSLIFLIHLANISDVPLSGPRARTWTEPTTARQPERIGFSCAWWSSFQTGSCDSFPTHQEFTRAAVQDPVHAGRPARWHPGMKDQSPEIRTAAARVLGGFGRAAEAYRGAINVNGGGHPRIAVLTTELEWWPAIAARSTA